MWTPRCIASCVAAPRGPADFPPLRSLLHFSRVTSLVLQSKGLLRAALDVRLDLSATQVFPAAQLGGISVTVTATTVAPAAVAVAVANLQRETRSDDRPAACLPVQPTTADGHRHRGLNVCTALPCCAADRAQRSQSSPAPRRAPTVAASRSAAMTVPAACTPETVGRSAGARRMAGSFEECLLSGRLPHARACRARGFTLDLSVAAHPSTRLSVPFDASFFATDDAEPSPYTAAIELDAPPVMPRCGVLQAVVLNPERTALRLFAVPYDCADMPPDTHTFQRQRSVVPGALRRLRDVIHLRIACTAAGDVVLCGLQLVFASCAPGPGEVVDTETETPSEPRFAPRTGSAVKCAPMPRPSTSPGKSRLGRSVSCVARLDE